MHIYLVRHGATEWSHSGRHTSRTDLPLTPDGETAAKRLVDLLHPVTFSHVLTSPRLRAIQTSELAGLAFSAVMEPQLVEWDYGSYEGLTTPEIIQSSPQWNLFRDGCPNGENTSHVSLRADELLARLRCFEGNVALFTHGHFGSVLAARWLGLPVESGQHFPLSTASLSILSLDARHDQTPVITLWNRT